MDPIELHSAGRCGIEIAELPECRTVYCNLSNYDKHEIVEIDVGIHIWAENLIEDPNPHKGEDCDFWDSWISLENYDRLLSTLEEFSTDEYMDVNEHNIAYTPCTSHTAICFMCGDDLEYRSDNVLSLTRSKGPVYCHESCVDEFYDFAVSLQERVTSIVSGVI